MYQKDLDGTEHSRVEECDLGALNAASAAALDVNVDPCTHDCQVSDKSKWRCERVLDGGSGRYVSKCYWLCGNQQVDIQEDEGLYSVTGTGANVGTYIDMIDASGAVDPEECDKGAHSFVSKDKTGFQPQDPALSVPLFEADPKINAALLLGCDANCKVVSGFRCPLAADVAAGNPAWSLDACTDRCGDGIYDGPYTEARSERSGAYPTGTSKYWSGYATAAPGYTEYIPG